MHAQLVQSVIRELYGVHASNFSNPEPGTIQYYIDFQFEFKPELSRLHWQGQLEGSYLRRDSILKTIGPIGSIQINPDDQLSLSIEILPTLDQAQTRTVLLNLFNFPTACSQLIANQTREQLETALRNKIKIDFKVQSSGIGRAGTLSVLCSFGTLSFDWELGTVFMPNDWVHYCEKKGAPWAIAYEAEIKQAIASAGNFEF